MTTIERPFGRYLEDFAVGDVYKHWPGKTITEHDDHLFCMITMNHHPLHTNEWFAEHETRAGAQRRRRQPRVLARARHERARRERRGHRQPRGRDAAAQAPDVPRRHHLRRDPGARREGVVVEARPRHRHRRDQGLQPGRQGGLLLPPPGHGVEARRGAAPPAPLRRPGRLGRAERCDRVDIPRRRWPAPGFERRAGRAPTTGPGRRYPPAAVDLLRRRARPRARAPGARPRRRHRQAHRRCWSARAPTSWPSSRVAAMRAELDARAARASRRSTARPRPSRWPTTSRRRRRGRRRRSTGSTRRRALRRDRPGAAARAAGWRCCGTSATSRCRGWRS